MINENQHYELCNFIVKKMIFFSVAQSHPADSVVEAQSHPTDSVVEAQCRPTDPVVEAFPNKKKNKFYAELEEFTISNDEDLAAIEHIRIFSKLQSHKKYNCIRCNSTSRYFSEADRHKMGHDYNKFWNIRDALKTIEIDRASYSKEIRHLKNIMSVKI